MRGSSRWFEMLVQRIVANFAVAGSSAPFVRIIGWSMTLFLFETDDSTGHTVAQLAACSGSR